MPAHRTHRLLRGSLVAALAITTLTTTTGPASADPAPGAEPADAAGAGTPVATITLLTGDVVHLTELPDGRQFADVDQTRTTSSGVHTVTIDKELYVFPADALAHIASGRLDRALFNVTALAEAGYDDETMSSLPLIVQYDDAAVGSAAPTVSGAEVVQPLPSIDGAAVAVQKDRASDVWATLTATGSSATDRMLGTDIEKVWLDGKVEATLAESVPLIGAPQAWEAGFDGTGVEVAILDSGIDATHPDLVDQITETQSFVPGEAADVDANGHGTHVASTVAGNGTASEGAQKGVAPGADLLIGKVLDTYGSGQDSWVIAGMEWAAAAGADVINMSLGTSQPSDGTDPMSQAVNSITAESGALFVIAAGNQGYPGTIGSPGAADSALTVGGTDDADQLGWFTSQGPRFGDNAIKPDLTAPGVDITAARSQQSFGEGMYVTMEGTSMASPHVAGAAAILAQRNPTWTGQQIKNALMSSAKELPGRTPYEVGTGRLDVASALDPISATGTAWSGFLDWPHEGDVPIERTVTYRNAGDVPITLTLDAAIDAPAGTFTLSASEVTVPAAGSADVIVTADPSLASAGVNAVGTLIATDGEGVTRARTSIGLSKESEQYDLTIRGVDREGVPKGGFFVLLDLDTGALDQIALDSETGATTLRRGPHTFAVMMIMDVTGEKGAGSTGGALLTDPEIVLDRDTEVVLDARAAVPVTATTWKSDSDERFRRFGWFRSGAEHSAELGYLPSPVIDTIYAAPTEPVSIGEFEFYTRWRVAKPLLTVHHEGVQLDEMVQSGVQWLDGELQLEAVDVGLGTTAEWSAIEADGKVVTVTRSDSVLPADLAQAASDAGARLLLVVNDRPGPMLESFYKPDWTESEAMVAALRQTDGDPLVADVRAGGVVLDVLATATTPYVIDLVDVHPDAIPGDLAYAPTKPELARVRSRYQSPVDVSGVEFRWDLRPWAFAGVGSGQRIDLPDVRREWVTPGDTAWHQNIMQATGWDVELESRNDEVMFGAGDRLRESWFGPVIRPRLGGAFWRPSRSGDFMSINIPHATDSGEGHGGAAPWGLDDVTSRFYQGDELLKETVGQAVYPPMLPPERTQYRVEMDADRNPDRWRTSTQTRSAWTFWSEHTDAGTASPLPLLQLDYHVPTNRAGDLRRRATTIGVKAEHMPEIADAPEVTTVSLELSFDDGGSWVPVSLVEDGSGWLIGELPEMPSGTAFVSLRAGAEDADGNAVEQEVVRAVGLRD